MIKPAKINEELISDFLKLCNIDKPNPFVIFILKTKPITEDFEQWFDIINQNNVYQMTTLDQLIFSLKNDYTRLTTYVLSQIIIHPKQPLLNAVKHKNYNVIKELLKH